MDAVDAGIRFSSRALIVDPDQRVLLAEHEIAEGTVWVGPGGGVEDGETLTEALARELREEAGMVLREDSEPRLVWIQEHDRGFGPWAGIRNHFFLLRTEDFAVIPGVLGESGFPLDPGLLSMRWWTPEEVAAAVGDAGTLFSPRVFPALLPDLLSIAQRGTQGSPIRLQGL